jgi:hypothetical protein
MALGVTARNSARDVGLLVGTLIVFCATVLSAVVWTYGILIVAAVVFMPFAALVLNRPWIGLIVLAIQLPFGPAVSRIIRSGALLLAWGALKDVLLLLLLIAALRTRRRVPIGIIFAVGAFVLLAIPAELRTGHSAQSQ